jgi:Ca-activated chloride channel family protein
VSAPALALLAAALQAAPPPSFGVAVEGVYVDVFVTDGNRPVVGLTDTDFELRDNGVRQQVELVAVESLPLTTFLVLDASGSVAGWKLIQLQAAGRALLRGLRPGGEAALVTFDQEIAVRVPATSDRARLEGGLARIRPGGATALYDALYAGALLASGRGRSLLVLFTDGEDNLSWLDATDVRRVLLESNVLVQAVGIVPADEGVPPAGLREPGGTPGPATEAPHVQTLRVLAEATGGRFWPAASPDRLADAFLAILEAMKTRYILRFEPDRVRREGPHELQVKLVRRKGKVHCRKAYFVGPKAP